MAIAGLFAVRAIAGGLNGPLPENNIFDYVIVGGGPAGLTVANRLTEDSSITVLLLEAGAADQYEAKIMIPYLQGSAGLVNGQCGGYNWCDNTVPQTYLDGNTRLIPQGRGLGGGTLINAMLWNRGDPADYDTWAKLGNDGWDYNSMLPYFQKSETFNAEQSTAIESYYAIGEDSTEHGFSGPQNVSFPNYFYEASSYFFAAMNSLAIPNVTDPSAPTTKGAMFLPQGISSWNQSRADARRARFDPVSTRDNLYVSTNQHVHRVLFEDCGSEGARAIGVEASSGPNAATWTAVATREVILAAGALRTPQTLELSGIGNNATLSAYGIETRISLPGVGNNLQDHMLMHMSQGFNNTDFVYSNMMNNQTVYNWAREAYYANRSGPLTNGPPDGNAFLSLPQFSNRSQALASMASAQSDDEYLAAGLDQSVIRGYARQRALLIPALTDNSRGAIEFLQDNAGNTQISNQRPLTRGSVHISSTDPFTYPALDFRYGSNPVDYQLMLDALRFNDLLFQQPALQFLKPIQNDPPHAASDAVLERFLNSSLGTEYHPSGTAAMLPREDGGVVDGNLIVYGTLNLRVVDASIFPIIPASHLEAVVYGVSEKAADLIKKAAFPAQTPSLPLSQATCTNTTSNSTKPVNVAQAGNQTTATTASVGKTTSLSHAGNATVATGTALASSMSVPANMTLHSATLRTTSATSNKATNKASNAASKETSSSSSTASTSSASAKSTAGSYPPNNVYSNERGQSDATPQNFSIIATPGYPIYNPGNVKTFDPNDPNRPASVGQPVGAALLYIDQLVSGINTLGQDIVQGLTGPLLGGSSDSYSSSSSQSGSSSGSDSGSYVVSAVQSGSDSAAGSGSESGSSPEYVATVTVRTTYTAYATCTCPQAEATSLLGARAVNFAA